MLYLKSKYIPPEEIFATKLGGTWEMVSFLIFIEVLNVIGCDVASPLKVEEVAWLVNHDEPCVFAGCDNSVINVSGLRNLESHE